MGDNNAAGQQEMGKMKRTKEGDNKGRETIARRRESDVRESGQMRKIIGGILGEKGKDRMYEEKGAGAWKKGKETNEKGNTGRDERDEGHKDVGAGPNQREEEREEGKGEKEKGGGGTDSDSNTLHGRPARDDAHHDRHARDLTMEDANTRGEDIQAREEQEEGHHGANVPHHSAQGVPNEGPNKE